MVCIQDLAAAPAIDGSATASREVGGGGLGCEATLSASSNECPPTQELERSTPAVSPVQGAPRKRNALLS